jgi:Mg2+/Co2+ transporter CorB
MDTELLYYVLTIALFLLISAFFSASETALTALSRARIYQLVMNGNKAAQVVSKLRREKESMIGAILLGNNAVNIAASAMATAVSIKYFGDSNGLVMVTLVMTLLVVIFSEILPKTYAIQNAERVSLAVSPALNIIIIVLRPITLAIHLLIRYPLKFFGVNMTDSNTLISATDVIRGTIELHHREGNMIKQDRDMLGSILDLNDIEVREIAIHRKQVETLEADLPADELIRQAVGTMHSRIPLWRGEPDNIIGLLHVKDLVRSLGARQDMTSEAILAMCKKPWFIPETTSLRDQLLAFRNRRQHFAFIVDEYGSWEGIVTLEDIIEEIVGEIDDEHDEADNDIQKVNDHAYIVHGSVTLRDLNRQLDWNLPDDNASTVAGLLIHEAQTIPAIGEYYEILGIGFTVLEKDAMQITRLRIERLPDTTGQDMAEP